MIALTQEKREELAKFAKATLNSLNGIEPEDPNQYDDCLSEYTQKCMEIAIASLTAESKTVRLFGDYGEGELCWIECDPSEEGAQKMYPAPPVPEVNTSNELTALLRAIELFQAIQANDRWNESGKLDDAYGELSEAAIKAAPLIKRLNGSGE
ncbi:hypothetical protein [Rosenbergiella nectarea]|uniref:hypothetical protein n=1 Tax=Rosenbergiella nectarea TaxID=988801 RepID=UPI001F4EDA5B|nr:hypothetical protein [Rosenbergiella nectarea]